MRFSFRDDPPNRRSSVVAPPSGTVLLALSYLYSRNFPGEALFTIGLVLQELLQGFSGPKSRKQIVERFSALPLIVPDRSDHIEAAELRNICCRKGVQIGTVDALLAQLCIRHTLTMLSTDRDFVHVAKHSALKVWSRTTR